MKNRHSFFLVLISICLLLPVLTFNFKHNQISVTENRALAELPNVSAGADEYMSEIDNYVSDRIGFRESLVQLYRDVRVNVLNCSNGAVIRGKEGWLFYEDDIPDYTGINIDETQIEYWASILFGIHKWCEDRDITFVFMVGPNKSSIYSQYMPDYIKKCETTKLDLLIDRLQEYGINTICPKNALQNNRDNAELYQRLDTHWNGLGSRYAIDEMVEKLDLPKHSFEVRAYPKHFGDLFNMLGVSTYNAESIETTVTAKEGTWFENKAGTEDIILHSDNTASFVIFRDSFTTALLEYFSYYFSGPIISTLKIDFQFVEQEAPQYLILECVERNLYHAIESNAGVLYLN